MARTKSLFSPYKDTIKDDYSIVTHALKGVDVSVFFDLVNIASIKQQQLAEEIFAISLKTFKRYERDEKKLDARSSELALKLLVLYRKGIEVFSTIDSFNNWLHKPAFGLGHRQPYKIMNTSTGIDLILDELIRIEYGSLA